jgi:hypothetical protein
MIVVDDLQSQAMLIYLVWDPHDCKLWLPENPPPLLLSLKVAL